MRKFWAIIAGVGVALASIWTWFYWKLIKKLIEDGLY